LFKCEHRGKITFIEKIFTTLAKTQAIIFVNTKDFCETVYDVLRKNGLKPTIMFGKMEKEERDEMMRKFRNGEVNVIIATDMLSRGIDVPEVDVVINFDVPTKKERNSNQAHGDPETYMHRIGRAGRFGQPGIALTLYDRDQDLKSLQEILDNFKMEVKDLDSFEHFQKVYDDMLEQSVL
jgi:ATP-dependent RNA helicase DDX19/DBP5